MTVYFGNAGLLDLDVVRLMGVSVKETGNPIGYFGTGLKYAIATILRHKQKMAITIGGDVYMLTARTTPVRGQDFDVVYMNDEQLGFTTELGKNWELWQAYRELHSNCLDEFGSQISTMKPECDTIIEVHGALFEEEFHKRHEVFLTGDPAWITEGVEIHHGTSKYLYYRGVRVHELKTSSLFTYNITKPMKLTEDRTLGSEWDANYLLSNRLPTISDPGFCSKLANPDWDGHEAKELTFSYCDEPSPAMLDIIEQRRDNQKLSRGLKNLLKKHRKVTMLEQYDPSPEDLDVIDKARSMTAAKLNCNWSGVVIKCVETLGPNVYAMVESGEIYITRQCLSQGVDFLAITLYEEWIHLRFGYTDESRALQQFLFDKILELIKK